jgi:hypothetical protein
MLRGLSSTAATRAGVTPILGIPAFRAPVADGG